MVDDTPDLSPLDPSRDAARWAALAASITGRAVEARRRRPSIARQTVAWAPPAALLAAAAAVVALAGASLRAGTADPATAGTAEPAFAVASWAAADRVPPTETVLAILGGSHESD